VASIGVHGKKRCAACGDTGLIWHICGRDHGAVSSPCEKCNRAMAGAWRRFAIEMSIALILVGCVVLAMRALAP
jgi:hypothetical protein